MSGLFSTPGAPPARNLTSEMRQTLQGYKDTAQGYFNLNQQIQPQYQELALQQGYNQLFGIPGRVPGTLATGASANTFTRGADIADVARLGPAAAQAYLASKPGLGAALDTVRSGLGGDPLLTALNQQAGAQLATGGQLTPEAERAADQQAIAGYSARGMSYGNQSLAAEILNRDAAQRARLAAAQQFGGNVEQLNQAQRDYAGRAAQIFSTTLSDPFQTILSRTSGAGGGGGTGSYGGYPQAIGTGAKMFDPTNAYSQDLFNTNYNAQAAANIAAGNQSSALGAAGIGAAGSTTAAFLTYALPAILSASAASDKRLKTNIRKVGKTPSGILLKSFSYKGDETRPRRKFIGAVAQDVEKIAPHAVSRDPFTGYRRLNYSAIDAPFMELAA